MIDLIKKEWFFLILFLGLSLFYFTGMDLVPFHPDESTQIFMSQDLFDYIKDPFELSYQPDSEQSAKMTYRAIDMPFTHYLIGFARLITGSPALKTDWNWSLTWDQNSGLGAIPSPRLLTTARFIPTLLLSFSIYLFYFSIRRVLPKIPALISTLFLGLNPLILLHGRRAMAEPALLFGTALFLWAVSRDRIRPVLVGISLALAFNAKQTGIFLIPGGIIAVCVHHNDDMHLKNMLARSAALLAVFLLITLLLNPYYWKSPFSALAFSLQSRSQLFTYQMADHLPGGRPNIPTLMLNLVANLFILPPSVSEIGIYLVPLTQQIQEYQKIIFHSWGRSLFAGSIQLSIVLSGIYFMVKRHSKLSKPNQQIQITWLLTALILTLGLLIALPIPWQRYTVPLLPLVAFWFGYAFLPFSEALQSAIKTSKTTANTST